MMVGNQPKGGRISPAMAAGLSDRLLDMSETADAPPADDLQEARGV